jgi:hypothetical protein
VRMRPHFLRAAAAAAAKKHILEKSLYVPRMETVGLVVVLGDDPIGNKRVDVGPALDFMSLS